jgi:hypothetical protein
MTQLFDFAKKIRIYYLIQPLTLLLIRAVALQRADREGFADEGGLLGHRGMLGKQGWAILAQNRIPSFSGPGRS